MLRGEGCTHLKNFFFGGGLFREVTEIKRKKELMCVVKNKQLSACDEFYMVVEASV